MQCAGGKAVPIRDFIAKWNTVNDLLGFVLRAVDGIAEVHPYAKIACSVISFIPKVSSYLHVLYL